jgi:hypothetical protein
MSAGAPLAEDQPLRVGSDWRTFLLRMTGEPKYAPVMTEEVDEKHMDEKRDVEAQPPAEPERKCKRKMSGKRVALVGLVALLAIGAVTHRSRCGKHNWAPESAAWEVMPELSTVSTSRYEYEYEEDEYQLHLSVAVQKI